MIAFTITDIFAIALTIFTNTGMQLSHSQALTYTCIFQQPLTPLQRPQTLADIPFDNHCDWCYCHGCVSEKHNVKHSHVTITALLTKWATNAPTNEACLGCLSPIL